MTVAADTDQISPDVKISVTCSK